jgi:C4-dicarboxylate-specific signal transduction histidine kinase
VFEAVTQNATAPLLRWFGSLLKLEAQPAPHKAIRDGNPDDGQKWLIFSTWTIAVVLGSFFCLTVILGVLGPAYLQIPPGHTLGWHFRPYRLPTIVILGLGQLALIVAITARDHRRRKAERLLREGEVRMALAVEAAEAGLWRWNAATDRFWMTEYCRTIMAIAPDLDYSLGAAIAMVHPDDLQPITDSVRKARETGALFEVQFRITIGEGQKRWVRCRGRPEHDAQGTLLRMSGTMVDISERMTMQAEIELQRQSLIHLTRVGAIGELSGALAHELNQPLTAILSNAQAIQRMIRRDPINIEELRGAIADIIEDDSRAGDVIRHLRTLLKKEVTQRQPVDMASLVGKVIGLARNELVTRHVMPVIQMPEEASQVLGDTVQLQQLLLNLILNAVEAIASAGTQNGILMITGQVVTIADENLYNISVSDTGPGIKPEIMEKLFEPFFSTKKQGLGLGLSISHAIVTGHGGSIRAETNLWGGATFHIFLPLAPREAA